MLIIRVRCDTFPPTWLALPPTRPLRLESRHDGVSGVCHSVAASCWCKDHCLYPRLHLDSCKNTTHMFSSLFLLILLALSSIQCHARQCAFVHHLSRHCRQSHAPNHAIPPGRVEDIDEWLQLSSDSLEKFTGKSLLDVMEGVTTLDQIHSNTRYAVLSHGNQTDPIYNYFNKGALLQFQWPEHEIYSLPSRYSAPDGALRNDRAKMMKTVEQQQQVRTIPTAIRQTKSGKQFQLHDVMLWNVYDKDGIRVGQTAIFDRTLIAYRSQVS